MTRAPLAGRWSEPIVIAGFLLALGAAAGGWAAGRGFAIGRSSERYVTVKGVSEKDVKADHAYWSLRLVVADNNLSAGQARLRSQVTEVRAFLARQHLDTSQIELQGFSVSDAYTNQERTSLCRRAWVPRLSADEHTT